jgi:cytochrome c peroxidase
VCHTGPHYTNQQLADVGTGKPTDRSPLVDVPQLTNVALAAPYLHDGSARTFEEIWTVFNPHDRHGVTNDLSKDELNDLIEYLKTL